MEKDSTTLTIPHLTLLVMVIGDVRTVRYKHLALYTGNADHAVINEEGEERDDGEEEAAAEKGR